MFGFILLGGVATIASALIAVAINRARTATRRMPQTPIGSVDGRSVVRVHGGVHARETIAAPLTGRPCVYWRLIVRVDMVDLVDTDHLARACDFDVHDETGVAQVVAERARFEVVTDIVEMDRSRFISAEAAAVLESFGIVLPQVGAVELREGIIAPGDALDLIGQPVCEPRTSADTQDRGYREAPPFVAVFSVCDVLGEQREGRYLGKLDRPDARDRRER